MNVTNNNDTVSSFDALAMLDTDITEDMESYGEEVTNIAIKTINSSPEIFKYIKSNSEFGLSVKDSATTWANNHNNEFGELFQTELDLVDWTRVARAI